MSKNAQTLCSHRNLRKNTKIGKKYRQQIFLQFYMYELYLLLFVKFFPFFLWFWKETLLSILHFSLNFNQSSHAVSYQYQLNQRSTDILLPLVQWCCSQTLFAFLIKSKILFSWKTKTHNRPTSLLRCILQKMSCDTFLVLLRYYLSIRIRWG